MLWGSLLLFLKQRKKLVAAVGVLALLAIILAAVFSDKTLTELPLPDPVLGVQGISTQEGKVQVVRYESKQDLSAAVRDYIGVLLDLYSFEGTMNESDDVLEFIFHYTGPHSIFASTDPEHDLVILDFKNHYYDGDESTYVVEFRYYSPFTFRDFGTGDTDISQGSQDDEDDTSASRKTLVSEPLEKDPLSYSITADSVYIQDPAEFCGSELTLTSSSSTGSYYVRKFAGSSSDKKVLTEYVSTICNGYNLAVTAQYDESYDSNFFSWGIDYTGSGNVDSLTDVLFLDDVQANICVYGIIDGNDLEAILWIPQDMEIVDLGLRYGGGSETVSLAGDSALAGLYKLSDGSFETTDGRLSVELGEAVVLRDGKTYTTEATFNRDSQLNRDELWVRNFYRDETLFFCAPENRLETGDIYTLKDLVQEADWINSMAGVLDSADSFTDYNWTLFFGAGHDGDFITPLLSDLNKFEDLTVRVMYWDEGVEAVYYICAVFDSSPHTVEALCAVDLSGTGSGSSSGGATATSSDYTLYVGESLQITCPTKFDTNYELFRWQIVSGSSLVSLSGSNSETCTIKGNQAGTVRVRVSYTYGVDEPDVLTGIDRNVDRTDTHEYVISVLKK